MDEVRGVRVRSVWLIEGGRRVILPEREKSKLTKRRLTQIPFDLHQDSDSLTSPHLTISEIPLAAHDSSRYYYSLLFIKD